MQLLKLNFFLFLFINSILFSQNQTVGVFQYTENAYDGYTLFSPSRDTYLIDNCGNMILLEEADRVLKVLKQFILKHYPSK